MACFSPYVQCCFSALGIILLVSKRVTSELTYLIVGEVFKEVKIEGMEMKMERGKEKNRTSVWCAWSVAEVEFSEEKRQTVTVLTSVSVCVLVCVSICVCVCVCLCVCVFCV